MKRLLGVAVVVLVLLYLYCVVDYSDRGRQVSHVVATCQQLQR